MVLERLDTNIALVLAQEISSKGTLSTFLYAILTSRQKNPLRPYRDQLLSSLGYLLCASQNETQMTNAATDVLCHATRNNQLKTTPEQHISPIIERVKDKKWLPKHLIPTMKKCMRREPVQLSKTVRHQLVSMQSDHSDNICTKPSPIGPRGQTLRE